MEATARMLSPRTISVATTVAFALSLAMMSGCSKDGAKASASSSPSSSSASEALKPKAAPLTPKVAEERLRAAGWTFEAPDASDDDWQSTYLKVEKGKDDNVVSAKVWIDAFSETASEGGPKPVLTMGKSALVRVGWAPESGTKKPAPDLAAISKDIAAVCAPEKVTDDFFFGLSKLDEAAKKWKVTNNGARGGGRMALSGVVYNYRFLDGEGGTVVIHDVVFGDAVKKGDAKLVGNTLVAVDADDDATKKKLYEVLEGG